MKLLAYTFCFPFIDFSMHRRRGLSSIVVCLFPKKSKALTCQLPVHKLEHIEEDTYFSRILQPGSYTKDVRCRTKDVALYHLHMMVAGVDSAFTSFIIFTFKSKYKLFP